MWMVVAFGLRQNGTDIYVYIYIYIYVYIYIYKYVNTYIHINVGFGGLDKPSCSGWDFAQLNFLYEARGWFVVIYMFPIVPDSYLISFSN